MPDSFHKPATDNIGAHLLGRIPSPPDARDYRAKDLLAVEKFKAGEFDPNLTIAALVQSGALKDWWSILSFWRWLKTYISGSTPTPTPTPTPDPTPVPALHTVPWGDTVQLDQGQTGHCVGFGCTGLEDSSPDPHTFNNAWAHNFYYYVKVNVDKVPMTSSAVEDGTYVRSGAKGLAMKGLIGTYAFAGTVDEIIQWLYKHGPVVVGTDWTNNMFYPNADGFVRPGGGTAGGHCYICLGYDPNTHVFTFQNSWGAGWGKGGRFFMTEADFRTLFSHAGSEALVTTDRA